jgi:hypothetical protein
MRLVQISTTVALFGFVDIFSSPLSCPRFEGRPLRLRIARPSLGVIGGGGESAKAAVDFWKTSEPHRDFAGGAEPRARARTRLAVSVAGQVRSPRVTSHRSRFERCADGLEARPARVTSYPSDFDRHSTASKRYPDWVTSYPSEFRRYPSRFEPYPDWVASYPSRFDRYSDRVTSYPGEFKDYPAAYRRYLAGVTSYLSESRHCPAAYRHYPAWVTSYPNRFDRYLDVSAACAPRSVSRQRRRWAPRSRRTCHLGRRLADS